MGMMNLIPMTMNLNRCLGAQKRGLIQPAATYYRSTIVEKAKRAAKSNPAVVYSKLVRADVRITTSEAQLRLRLAQVEAAVYLTFKKFVNIRSKLNRHGAKLNRFLIKRLHCNNNSPVRATQASVKISLHDSVPFKCKRTKLVSDSRTSKASSKKLVIEWLLPELTLEIKESRP